MNIKVMPMNNCTFTMFQNVTGLKHFNIHVTYRSLE